jgi:23S rRNA (pseudouridine1915-N3)-methyltransferase
MHPIVQRLLVLILATMMPFCRSFITRSKICHSSIMRQTQRALTVNILVVGKKNSVEPWIESACGEFEKRLKPVLKLNTQFLKSDEALSASVKASKNVVALDENGTQHTSREFSQFVYKQLEEGGATLTFVIGGFAGLPQAVKEGNYPLISLSKMTWTHQMARLLLIEQVYRAVEIQKGSGYHKD